MRLQPLCSPAELATPCTLIFVFSVYTVFSHFWFCFWLRRVSIAARWLLLAVASRCGAQTLEHMGSVVVAHRLSCPKACAIFPDQVSNPCVLCVVRWILTHWTTREVPLAVSEVQ